LLFLFRFFRLFLLFALNLLFAFSFGMSFFHTRRRRWPSGYDRHRAT
jgi:hypothetical protein